MKNSRALWYLNCVILVGHTPLCTVRVPYRLRYRHPGEFCGGEQLWVSGSCVRWWLPPNVRHRILGNNSTNSGSAQYSLNSILGPPPPEKHQTATLGALASPFGSVEPPGQGGFSMARSLILPYLQIPTVLVCVFGSPCVSSFHFTSTFRISTS